ncbi:MAG: DUF309 domain-containing protein [Pseudomonadota bacterium]
MNNQSFNPFTDRQARLIRNSLASALTRALAHPDTFSLAAIETVAGHLLQEELSPDKKGYIKDRMQRYAHCIAVIERKKIHDPLEQTFILWDEGLFFEVHDVLEKLWLAAHGRKKLALQGFIRAAGVYILMQSGRKEGMKKMAAKAIQTLKTNVDALPTFPSIDVLLEKLKSLDPVPPKLLSEEKNPRG